RFPDQETLLRGVFASAGREAPAPPQAAVAPDTFATTPPSQPGPWPPLPGEPGPETSDTLPWVPGYTLEGVLGRGGMGVVYKARQQGLNRLVALKMILAADHAGEQERLRFRTEAEAVARLQHPHIVQVFEVGEHQGKPFCALEFVSGGTLEQKLRDQPLPP